MEEQGVQVVERVKFTVSGNNLLPYCIPFARLKNIYTNYTEARAASFPKGGSANYTEHCQ